jgi:hypothetical protein
VAGCGKPQWGGRVSGKVLYKGKPLPSGAVTFLGPEGRAANAEIIDGYYAIARPPHGECKITVLTAPDVAPGALPAFAPADAPADKIIKPRGKYVPIPERYARPETSGLVFAVTDTAQTHNIELKP